MAGIHDVIEGLKILETYGAESVDAQHDVIYTGPGSDKNVSKEDAKKLKNLGWRFDAQAESWARFT